MSRLSFTRIVPLALALLGACDHGNESGGADDTAAFPTSDGAGKADVFGRSLVGRANPYPADPRLEDPAAQEELDADPYVRRKQAWRTIFEVVRPVPLLGLEDVQEEHEPLDLEDIPEGPRFQTWYGPEELRRMFVEMLTTMSDEDLEARRGPNGERIEALMEWNATALDRSDRWPLDRYLAHIKKLDDCDSDDPQACALELDAKLGGAVMGVGRVVYGPKTAGHALRSWGSMVDCLDELDGVGIDAKPDSESDFTACLKGEMPTGAVVIKAQWDRVGFERTVPVFDTDEAALRQRLSPTSAKDWGDKGDRRADPQADSIYTVQLRDGSRYRLTGMHIMTKELRHWQWITLWWSDTPDSDFGADRPKTFDALPDVWRNYKMCAVTSYEEGASDPGAGFEGAPSLQSALRASVPGGKGAPSWCSNPYLEHGRGNTATNCIGCHQHGGATVTGDYDGDGELDPLDLAALIDDDNFPEHGRTKMREVFPADYIWSWGVGDDLLRTFEAELIKHMSTQ
ncbi:MAG: hypothetical protein AAF721_18945 [Myxococcota bacterium]